MLKTMLNLPSIMAVLIALFLSTSIAAQDREAFIKEIFVNEKGDSLQYRIMYPDNYDEKQEYPLILFLHGAGERGNDNESQLIHGADFFLENRSDYPAIVVFPQCPEDRYWINIDLREKLYNGEDLDFIENKEAPSLETMLLKQLLDSIIANESLDEKRLYLMGLSMGGFGTFDMLGRWPETFAAAVAICGGGNVALTEAYAPYTALWITHGAQDNVVPVRYSRRVYQALKKHGAAVKYTEFPEANHNAWDPTFEMSELMPWLFSKSKQQ